MESKDIIKALECCIKSSHLGECFENKCPLVSEKGCKVGKETLYPYALDLIKNQQAEIEMVKDDLLESNIEIAELYKCKFSAENVAQNIVIAKTEAYKEFAILSKERLTGWETDPTDEEIEDTLDIVLEELAERKEDEGK